MLVLLLFAFIEIHNFVILWNARQETAFLFLPDFLYIFLANMIFIEMRNLGGFFCLVLILLILLADLKTYLENYSNLKINNNCMQAYLAAQQDLFLEKVSALFLLHFRFRVLPSFETS